MFCVNPVIALENGPDNIGSVVLLFAVVGFADVFQHTPLAVIVAPPSLDIIPPLVAVVYVIDVITVVVKTGTAAGSVVNDT